MLECLATPKQWSKIARKFPGRTQHHIKNRFICLLAKEMSCKAEKIRKMIKKNTIKTVILETIKSLDSKLQPKDSFPLDTKQNESVKSKIEENVDFSMTNSEISEKKSIPNEDNQMKNLWDNTPEEIFLESFSFFDNIDHFINFD